MAKTGRIIVGREAIAIAEATGATLHSYTTPVSEACDDVSLEEAREIANDDPSLIWTQVETAPAGCLLCSVALSRLNAESAAMAGALFVSSFGTQSMADTFACGMHGERALRAALTLGEVLTEAELEGKAVTGLTVGGALATRESQ